MKTNTYNPYIDILKFVLANLVVCIHFEIPGTIGEVINCLSRVAVPFFFMISGYYSYNCEQRVLWRRFIRNTILLISITLIYLLWGIWKTVFIDNGEALSFLHEKINRITVIDFLLYSVNPFSNHLWFLVALVEAYLFTILICSVIKNKKVLIIAMVFFVVVLLGLHFWMGSLYPILTSEKILKQYYRNTLLFGIPMFLVGYLINAARENRGYLAGKHQLIICALIISGSALGLLQWFWFGYAEMPFGIFIVSVAVFVLALEIPEIDNNVTMIRISKLLGKASVWIYIMHKLVGEVIEAYVPYNSFCKLVYNGARFTITVMIISSCLSLLISLVGDKLKRKKFT